MEQRRSNRRIRVDEQALRLFHQGTSAHAFDWFGAHPGAEGTVFRVWAPHAAFVSVIGDFNGWDPAAAPMRRVNEEGVWEVLLSSVKLGDKYKYHIRNGSRTLEKADPFGLRAELPPKTASVVWSNTGYEWRDASWLSYRKDHFTRETVMHQPLHVYELHAGSWRRHADGTLYSYTELAADLVTYVKQMGYTHVELLPLAEHPFDGSWGYQVCGYYAPTSRYGTPQELMSFVDTMHEAGIGVILDWVPAHFPKDAHGLCEFDGQPLYECRLPDRMEHLTWGTRCFDLERPEVQSFLLSNALYWIETFHADGLRVDAVASMLYLDFDRREGEWTPNRYGDNRNLAAIEFFQKLNRHLEREHPDVMTVAEESTAWAGLTRFEEDGLGFTFKWNMGWSNDTLSYLRCAFDERPQHREQLIFPVTYAFGERYVLPFSHDEVVHGKRSLLDRNPGDYDQKFAGSRLALAYLMTFPGKKLSFMASELGQFCEWDHGKSLEWFLLDYPKHAAHQLYAAELNHFYLSAPALWERDGESESFAWISADHAEQGILSYRRIGYDGRELLVLLNFMPTAYADFLLAVPRAGVYREVFSSDARRFGGTGAQNGGELVSEPCLLRGSQHAVRVKLPALCALILERVDA